MRISKEMANNLLYYRHKLLLHGKLRHDSICFTTVIFVSWWDTCGILRFACIHDGIEMMFQ